MRTWWEIDRRSGAGNIGAAVPLWGRQPGRAAEPYGLRSSGAPIAPSHTAGWQEQRFASIRDLGRATQCGSGPSDVSGASAPIDFLRKVGYIRVAMGMNGFDGALSGLRLQAVERRLR